VAGEGDRRGTAGDSSTEDENFILGGNLTQWVRCNWNLLFGGPVLKSYRSNGYHMSNAAVG
jgi:hypothetical protein